MKSRVLIFLLLCGAASAQIINPGGSGGSGTSAGALNDLQASGGSGAFAADSGQITIDPTNHRLCVNWSGGLCDTGIKYGPGTMTYLGAFGNGKTFSDGFSHRSFADEGTWTPTTTALGMASFAAVTTLTGSNATNHYAGFESIPRANETATLSLLYGFFDSPNIGVGATVSVRRAFDCEGVLNSGTLTTNECFYAAADTTGSSNWTLVFDKTAPSYMAGKLAVGGGNLAAADLDANFDIISVVYKTRTNCSSAGGTCAAATAGSVTIAAAATTVVVATTNVTANSQIFVQFDESLGTKLSVTCNSAAASEGALYFISARTAGTSFTIKTNVAPTTNPACLSYRILN